MSQLPSTSGNQSKKTNELSKSPITGAKVKKTPVAKVPCTPFCDRKIQCLKHHKLVIALMNCNDHMGSKSNILAFQQCVKQCIADGWDKNDIVPDESEELQFPLLHLACAFGKCSALDWLITFGLDPHVKSETTGQFALHKGIAGICRARYKGNKELIPKMKRFITALKKQLMFHDQNGDTPLHTAVIMLTNIDLKPKFFVGLIEVIVKEASKTGSPRTILDAINNEGKTALHVLASTIRKVEYCASAICALVLAGADKSIRDNDGQTAIDIALAGGVQNIVDELLKGHSGSVYSGIQHCITEMEEDHINPELCPSTSLTNESDSTWSEVPSSCPTMLSNRDFPTMTSISSMGIKREKGTEKSYSPTGTVCQNKDSFASTVKSSPPSVLKYLVDLRLLSAVEALVARARAEDEANLKKLQNQAKEFDIQIKNKKQEVKALQKKRKECDSEYATLTKRIHSCENAMNELPNL